MQGIDRPAMLGPDLSSIGTKVSREWIYKWLKEPRTIVDKDGNVTVNAYEAQDEPRMPKFRLTETELHALSASSALQTGNTFVTCHPLSRGFAAVRNIPEPHLQ